MIFVILPYRVQIKFCILYLVSCNPSGGKFGNWCRLVNTIAFKVPAFYFSVPKNGDQNVCFENPNVKPNIIIVGER